jgi:hypothetical protein
MWIYIAKEAKDFFVEFYTIDLKVVVFLNEERKFLLSL